MKGKMKPEGKEHTLVPHTPSTCCFTSQDLVTARAMPAQVRNAELRPALPYGFKDPQSLPILHYLPRHIRRNLDWSNQHMNWHSDMRFARPKGDGTCCSTALTSWVKILAKVSKKSVLNAKKREDKLCCVFIADLLMWKFQGYRKENSK